MWRIPALGIRFLLIALVFALGLGFRAATQRGLGDDGSTPTTAVLASAGDGEELSESTEPEGDASEPKVGSGQELDSEWTKHIVAYQVDNGLGEWVAVSYVDSSEVLRETLGDQLGTALDRVFHMDLAPCMLKGDRLPGLFISPEEDRALATYFHADGSLTEIRIVRDNGAWTVHR